MQIMLSVEQEQFIQAQIQRGIFASPDQAIAAALNLLEAQSQGHEQWVNEVRTKVDKAAEELARGEGIPLETVVGQIEEKFRKARSFKGGAEGMINQPPTIYDQGIWSQINQGTNE